MEDFLINPVVRFENPIRIHADLFTAQEAALYLRIESDSPERTLETLRTKEGLIGKQIGKKTVYHRRHLDSFIRTHFGIDEGRSLVGAKPIKKSL
jgi:hypothetical protein